MVERTNRQSGEAFYGCRRYPDCTGTRNVYGAVTTSRRGRTRDDSPDLPSDRARGNDRGRWRR